MYRNVFDVLEERGYFSQATHRDEIYELTGYTQRRDL